MSEKHCRFPLAPVQEELLQTVGDFIRIMGFSGPRHGRSSQQQRHPGKQSKDIQGLHGATKAFLCQPPSSTLHQEKPPKHQVHS